MSANALSALSVVCNHTTMPLVSQQAQEIKDLKLALKKEKDLFALMIKSNKSVRNRFDDFIEFMNDFGYGEEYDEWSIERRNNDYSFLPEEMTTTYFNPLEDYDVDDD